ncbi:hypothetical protein BN1517210001 [Staphylococcus capitis]|nr:hypothetical protein BN1517210001 [Staphylococcus capitis]
MYLLIENNTINSRPLLFGVVIDRRQTHKKLCK